LRSGSYLKHILVNLRPFFNNLQKITNMKYTSAWASFYFQIWLISSILENTRNVLFCKNSIFSTPLEHRSSPMSAAGSPVPSESSRVRRVTSASGGGGPKTKRYKEANDTNVNIVLCSAFYEIWKGLVFNSSGILVGVRRNLYFC
jgi:hypothetical protein